VTPLVATSGRGEPRIAELPLLRRAMVRRMVEGAQVPCFYLRLSADVSKLIALRREQNASGESRPLTLNDFIVRAVATSLAEHPLINSSFLEGTIATYPRINVGVGIAVEGGLVVAAIHDTDRLGLGEISARVRELVGLAERRKLPRELLADATFTVTNLGMYGIEEFDPIINPPQAAILAVGTAAAAASGRALVRLTLGCDHRVLTGAEAAPFLTDVRDRLQAPQRLREPPVHEREEQRG
jgi:pyruvate dehydrogenase E2 component (dihydrolipoamide acetyltransferase)